MDTAPPRPRSALPALIAAAFALGGCDVPYLHLDAARAGVIVDREGARAELSTMGVEMGGPRAPSEQAVTISAFQRMEIKSDWLRMAAVGQARFYAFRWLQPCEGSPNCNVFASGAFAPKSGPFHTVIAGKHGVPMNAIYLGKNNAELATVGAFLEGDLAWSGPMVKGVDAKGRSTTLWQDNFDRPRALAGLFATTSPLFLGGFVRLGLEGGAQYDGAEMGMFGRFWLGFGITNAPSPPRVEDVPPPYVQGR